MAESGGETSGKLSITADAHIWGVEAAFSSLPGIDVSLQVLEAAAIDKTALEHTDVLVTRSATRVNEELLAGTPVRFAATATIGDDHYDKAWLDANAIGHANAAGSSTQSVVEYMLTALLELHARRLIALPKANIGIIGAGRIGGALSDTLTRLGIPTLLNDPPRARKEGKTGFLSLDELLARADLLTLHTPLHRSGEDRTLHLLGRDELSRFNGRGIINAGRGACLDNAALTDWLNADKNHFAVLDCWENEPAISPALLAHEQVVIATPHIAGHSLDGKAANTVYARRAVCRWLGIADTWGLDGLLPPAKLPDSLPCTSDAWVNLHTATRTLYDIMHDNSNLRAALQAPDGIARQFVSLRRHYPARRSWNLSALHFCRPDPATPAMARAIGIKVV